MSEKQGIEQVKKVLNVLVEAGNVAEKMLNEKGGAVAKVTHLMKLTDEVVGLVGLNPTQLKAELADLDPAEKAELIAHAKEKFDLENDVLEGKIEAGLDLAIEAEAFIEKVVAFVKPAAPVAVEAPAPAPAV